jgi:monofunctional biosynthetic peptidoglycan transglycosylase
MAGRRSWLTSLGRVVFFLAAAFLIVSVGSVAALRVIDPPGSAVMAEASLDAAMAGDRRFRLEHQWVNLEHISPELALAVMASEDQKFPEHHGFDVDAIENAYETNQQGHRIRGASTISQQVAKNLFLWSGRSYFRKAVEAYYTVLLESLWPKRRILEVYLNIAEFGLGVYGAEAAAQHFFHESAARLSRSDAALLAAVLPNPRRFMVQAPSRFIQERRDWIEGQMQSLGGPEMLREIDAYPPRKR